MEFPLTELQPGEKAVAVRLTAEGSLARRMLDMGVVPGVMIEVIRRAPLGGPVHIRVRGYDLAMRRQECAAIMVEPLPALGTELRARANCLAG